MTLSSFNFILLFDFNTYFTVTFEPISAGISFVLFSVIFLFVSFKFISALTLFVTFRLSSKIFKSLYTNLISFLISTSLSPLLCVSMLFRFSIHVIVLLSSS